MSVPMCAIVGTVLVATAWTHAAAHVRADPGVVESTTDGMALGAAGMVAFFGSWVYGIMDAADSARRFNSVHGLAASGVEPVVAPSAG